MTRREFANAILLVSLASCGTDSTPSPPDDVSLTFERVSVGAKVVSAPLDLNGLVAEYLIPDPNDPTTFTTTPAFAMPGGWSAPIAEGTPPILFTLPDGVSYLYSYPVRHMHGGFAVFEHPNPTPPPANAMMAVSATLDTPITDSDIISFYSVGTWAQFDLTNPAAGATTVGPQSFPYASVINLVQPTLLAGFTPDDLLFVLRHADRALTGISEFTPKTAQTTSTQIDVAMTPVIRDQTLDLAIDPPAFAARFTGPLPAPQGPMQMAYNLVASSGFKRGLVAGPLLLTGGPALTDTAIQGTYGNPFLASHGWDSGLYFQALETRSFAPVAGDPGILTLITVQVAALAPKIVTSVELPAAMPQIISLNGVALTQDGMTVHVDQSRPATISFTTDGRATRTFQAGLFEVLPNKTGYGLVERLVANGVTPSWQIPSSFLVPGHMYVIRGLAQVGGPTLIGIDGLLPTELDHWGSAHDGAAFHVMP